MSKLFKICTLITGLALSLTLIGQINASAQILPPEGQGIYQFILPESYPAPEYNSICVVGYGDQGIYEGQQYSLPIGNYTVKYIDWSVSYDNDCNVIDENTVIDTAQMTISENSVTTITLDENVDYFRGLDIRSPQPIQTGTVTFILAERVHNVPITVCIVGDSSGVTLNQEYVSHVGRFTANLYVGEEVEGKDCSELSVLNPTDTIEFGVTENADTAIYIGRTEDGYKYIQPNAPNEPAPEEEAVTVKPIKTPRTGGLDLAKEAILVLFTGVSLGAIYLSLKPIKE
jgi:hypothetical protein